MLDAADAMVSKETGPALTKLTVSRRRHHNQLFTPTSLCCYDKHWDTEVHGGRESIQDKEPLLRSSSQEPSLYK